MKKYTTILLVALIFFAGNGRLYANWGWDATDDPVPYYHQEWGKWYQYEDTKVFMVQIESNTYKYVFDAQGELLGGWVTGMPMRL